MPGCMLLICSGHHPQRPWLLDCVSELLRLVSLGLTQLPPPPPPPPTPQGLQNLADMTEPRVCGPSWVAEAIQLTQLQQHSGPWNGAPQANPDIQANKLDHQGLTEGLTAMEGGTMRGGVCLRCGPSKATTSVRLGLPSEALPSTTSGSPGSRASLAVLGGWAEPLESPERGSAASKHRSVFGVQEAGTCNNGF